MRLRPVRPRLLLATSFVIGWVLGLSPLMQDGLIRGLTAAGLIGLVIVVGVLKNETSSPEL